MVRAGPASVVYTRARAAGLTVRTVAAAATSVVYATRALLAAGLTEPAWPRTDLTDEVWFYVRGEEYSAQVDHFAQCVAAKRTATESSFASAAQTDDILTMIRVDAERGPAALQGRPAAKAPAPKRFSLFGGKA